MTTRARKLLKYTAATLGVLVLLVAVTLGVVFYLLIARVEGAWLDTPTARVHYTDEGAGEPVILIHGVGANADLNWRRNGVIARLRSDFRVIAYDVRGHGLSDKPHDPAAYGAELIADVRRLMDHLEIERAHIAGYSLGGFIALAFATQHPERVRSVAYCASGWVDPTLSVDDVSSPYRMPPAADIERARQLARAALALGPAPAAPPRLAMALPGGTRLPGASRTGWLFEPFRDWVGDNLVDAEALRALKDGYEALVVTEEALATHTAPAICFIGTSDGLLPYALALHEQRPEIALVVMEGANHITTAMRRDFRERLHAFLLANRVR